MIKFKDHKRKDIPYRIKWLNNKKANVFISDNNKKTNRAKQIKWFDDYEKNKNKKFFTIYDEMKPIGFMGFSNIDKINKKAEIFIMIGDDNYRGRGYGKDSLKYLLDYGFKKLGMKKIYLGVYKENNSAISCYKSVGFKIEGVFKKDAFFNGRYHDSIMMAIFSNRN
jgi:RimJ/RimL family protein N-acetyltransferase